MPARGPLRDGRGGAEPGDEERPERAAPRPRGAPRAAADPWGRARRVRAAVLTGGPGAAAARRLTPGGTTARRRVHLG